MPHFKVSVRNRRTGLIVELGTVEARGPAHARLKASSKKYPRKEWECNAAPALLVFPKRA